jgi:type II secretory pathway pseudopilin PulG
MNKSTLICPAAAVGPRRRHSGFALIEALISLLVVAFGMLAIGAFHFTLSRSADIAKQRTEATRIAQSHIDRVRSFVSRASDGSLSDGRLTYTEDLAVGTVDTCPLPPTTPPPRCLPRVSGTMTNATFLPRLIVSPPTLPVPAGGESYRWVNVSVTWADRTGVDQSVSLTTAVSDGESSSLRGLASGSGGAATTLRPRNRNINVPYPAVNLAGGATSAFAPPPGSVVFIFDNNSGSVLGRCEGIAAPTEGATLTPASSGCSAIDAYIVSGYVRFKTSGATADRDNIDQPSDLSDPSQPLMPTVYDAVTNTFTSQPLTFNSSSTGYAPSGLRGGVECYAQEQATLRNSSGFEVNVAINPVTGTTYPSGDPLAPPSGYVLTGNPPRFIAYTCIVEPIDHDSNAATPKVWSAEITLNALTTGSRGWAIGTSSSDFKVCRFTSDYNRDNVLSNSEHPRYYRRVSGALDNQNYLVLRGGSSHPCPPDIAADPTTSNYQDTNSARHQPTSIAEYSFRCNLLSNGGPGSNTCSNANKSTFEPNLGSSPVAALPME